MRYRYQKGSLDYLRTKMIDYEDIIDIAFFTHKLIIYVKKDYDKNRISNFLDEIPLGIYYVVEVLENEMSD